MAQSSSAMREPTMDEILTSIREIIEENTAQDKEYLANQKDHHMNKTKAVNDDFQQDQYDSLSVDDAMEALAARIGLALDPELDSFRLKNQQSYSRRVSDNDSHFEIDSLNEKQKFHSKTTDESSFVKNVETIAEEDLRKVLNGWMEKQLPILVEKIVREEVIKALRGYYTSA
ncbi:DUF2497 domain-containing protein [Bartonella tamiae]|uniref:DUF2497 domain-containing protein n=1 Tax=Bartonella tamiae Th239 TaxID=1094558 RepID=J1JWP0_9HYPH|nr:DUF2497 domain-containing protein [Bartonella tamiae]EJF89000.1 hypothetical protein ME5_01551 [Bartonella tamiae Th239]EJF94750.1 hypothetical protein MEG_00331 [Bartonella tamiae Th307]